MTAREMRIWTTTILLGLLMVACGDQKEQPEEMPQEASAQESPVDFPLTAQERDALTPEDVKKEFQEGNIRFMKDSLTPRDRRGRMERTSLDQFPKAMVVSCIDSRVPVEEVFDQTIGDMFVGRIAGNFVDTEMLGSIEYATKVAGSKLVVVMGHESCGAVKSAIANVEMGNITALLDHIEPAIEMTDNFSDEERNLKNDKYVNEVITNNVRHNIREIRDKSSIIADMEKNGEIQILGAYYDLNNGEVVFFEEPVENQ